MVLWSFHQVDLYHICQLIELGRRCIVRGYWCATLFGSNWSSASDGMFNKYLDVETYML